MHPAYSIIFFTTASGLGYGLLALLGVFGAAGIVPPERWLGLAGLGLALAAVTAGLLSSTFHLGRPERAWRALTQWRSSWLSREGVMALATYVPAGLYAIGWVFFETTSGFWGLFGVLAAAGAGATVYCTAMIYASIRAVPRWHNRWVAPGYLSLALMAGALWLDAVLRLFGAARAEATIAAAIAVALAWAVKARYWRDIDRATPAATAGTATGLGHLGAVRLLDPPHTADNYLQREMGYRVARKHARKLRRIAILTGFAAPLVLALLAGAAPGPLAAPMALLGAVLATFGTVVERWLFFAEARHVVALYYGADSA